MGKGHEQTFFQRHANGQQVHEKVPNIINHQGNANQNHNEISLHACKNDYHPKDKKQQMLLKMWSKGNPCALLLRM